MAEMRMFLLQPAVVFRARVNMNSVTYPVTQITYDNVTQGAYTAIKPNMTLLLGTSAGADDLGRTRVHVNGATSSVIRVGMSSTGTRDGELTVDDNAYITVLNDYRVWAKPPYIDPSDGTIYKDGVIAFSGQTQDPPPVAICLPSSFAGTISGANVLTVELDASNSYSLDPIFAAIDGYLWDVADGTITVGSSTSESITVTFPPGFRWVILRVETITGKYGYRYIPIFARDPANDVSITDFQIAEHVGKPDGGQRVSLRIYQALPRSTYPDGTLMMLWDREPLAADNNRNIRFVGWHHNDNAGVQANERAILKDTTLTFLDVAGKLATLPGFPQRMGYAASPASWEESTITNIRFYMVYLLGWHSTALELGGLRVAGSTPSLELYPFAAKESDAGNLYDQAQALAQSLTPDFCFGCTRQGDLMVAIDPIIQDVTNRTVAVNASLTEADWMELRWEYQRPPRVYQLRSYAVIGNTSTITPIRCVAPGVAPGQGGQYIETSERIAASQNGLNIAEGNRHARLNARYGLFAIIMPFERLSVYLEPAFMQWVTLTVSVDNGPYRGLTLTAQRGLVKEYAFHYDYTDRGVICTATLLWEMETSGPPAVTEVLD